MKKPVIRKIFGKWQVVRRSRSEQGIREAMSWCHARNIAEGNYR